MILNKLGGGITNNRLRYIRKDKHLSQEEFGKRIGIGKTSVSKLESGENKPSEQTIMLICREFNINEVWLRTGEGGDENMYKKLPDEDRLSLSLGKLSMTENEFVKRGVNLLAETAPDKLKILEEFMKKWLGIE